MSVLNAAIEEPTRSQVTALLERAKSDGNYAERLRNDPDVVLSEAGLNQSDVGELSQEIRLSTAEVEGHLPPGCYGTCDRITCWITICGYIPYTR